MSDFPQMPKRSVELPLGCKDLMDIEAIRNWKPVGDRDWPWRVATDRLAYIEGQLAELLHSAGKSKLVSISRYQDHGQVMVIPDADLGASVIIASWRGASEGQTICQVFEDAGISPITGPLGRWKTKDHLKYTLPVEAADGARLIRELFRVGYGLGDMAVINLSHHERKPA